MKLRKPAVADLFYPGHRETLAREVDGYLAEAQAPDLSPQAIIAPHAGYAYSGSIAASAFRLLKARHDRIARVLVIGPSHRHPFDGIAAPTADAFETPLGTVPLDRDGINLLVEEGLVREIDQAHAAEHGLEVHLPFLQQILDAFTLIPLVVGNATGEDVARVFERVWNDTTLFSISSDLSHYHDYETARMMDERTSQSIEALRPEGIGGEDACGYLPIQGLLHCARNRGMLAHRLDLRNSGDTAGSRDRVVGYGAYAFTTP